MHRVPRRVGVVIDTHSACKYFCKGVSEREGAGWFKGRGWSVEGGGLGIILRKIHLL